MKHPGMINEINYTDSSNFEWSDNNFNKIKNIINKYPQGKQQSAILPVLDIAQRQNNGWLSKQAIEKVAETLSISFIRVMEIATFYSMFNLEPIGKYFIQMCRTTPCWLRGSDNLMKIAKEITGCEIGETSKDNLFTLVEVECLGACCNAPMVQINDDYYEDLDDHNFKELLFNLKKGISVKKGSQIKRQCSEPIREK
jgi:NADH-quinone oxidoreductase E subunit